MGIQTALVPGARGIMEEVKETVEAQEVVQEAASPKEQPKEAEQERNWRAASETLRLQKQRIEELENRLKEQQTFVRQEAPAKEEPDEFDKLDPDDYLTVSKAKELAKKLAAKEAEQTAKKVVMEYAQQQQIVQDESRMRAKYEDFDFVIENFAVPMIKNDPALAYKIQNSKNPAETAYKLAKISEEYEEMQSKQQVSPKAEKVMKNSSRPVSGQAASNSLKTQADDFSKLSPQEIWSMSQKYSRGG